jgi:hypothetical protein
MKRHISLSPETPKLWNLETLSICLEHSLAVSTEARHQWLLPSARSSSSQSAVTLHLVFPNPYTFLALIQAKATCLTCLDSKVCIFSCVSQPIFAFQCEEPQWGGQQQLTWTCLPQGLKNAPTIFGTALASNLWAYPEEEAGCTLLKYVDDLLLAAANYQDFLKWTGLLLCLLWKVGYKVPQKKAQICQDQVKYLGFHTSLPSRNLVQKENKLSAQAQLQLQENRNISSWEWLGSARFGNLISHC